MKRLFVPVFLLAALLCALGEGIDDQYVRIYNVIQEADALSTRGQSAQALSKYLQAQSTLQKFQQFNPEWNVKIVAFRLNYLASKVSALSASVPAASLAATTNRPPSTASAAPGAARTVSPGLENQLTSLRDQVRQMQVDKIVLEAKLKESLAAQPAATDPRELSKAEERIKSLQKENALLNVSLSQARTNTPPVDPAALKQAQQTIADSNRQLAEQTAKINALALEKTALQQKLESLVPATWNAAALESTKKALDDTTARLKQQQQATAQATADRDKLQARVSALSADADAAAALRAENQFLKKQVADLRVYAGTQDKTAETERRLVVAQAQIAALQSDKELLRVERMALQNRVKQLALLAGRPAGGSRPEDVARMKLLERERDDLQKRLETANKELASRNNKLVVARVLEMENQMAGLRARLEVFEALAVPYTADELALFKRPDINLTAKEPASAKKSIKELPSGSASLVADAQRYFAERQFDKAEEKYLLILEQDDKNVPTLANLATIQIERNRYEEAERNIKQAVVLAPEDAYSWLVLGQLKFRMEKYDDALEALSRAAKLDPQDAQIQNYLGITLSQKGMRGPAETALRKAIQLDPGNASAHHNLAVVYLTQRPPLVELARWHYQKALSAGHGRNPEVEKMLQAPQTAASR